MSDVAIRAVNLSKAYNIRLRSPSSSKRTLQEDIVDLARRPFRRGFREKRETVWAVKDVSFEIKPGEVVGIIGRNGAGKSTLLKILSRITEPTSGYADLYGRVGSLLEVGTGFHTELTGRENIYLRGAVLGMSRKEIKSKFDEIVDFSGIEKFLDTPVKRYSSGMGVRLAFSVAAHLEPEILLIDEVLAVGDAEFQKKSLGKMGEVAKGGRTVLFVSHNMGHVQKLCKKSILLNNGIMTNLGETSDVIQGYFGGLAQYESNDINLEDLPRWENLGERIKFAKCVVHNSKDQQTTRLRQGESFRLLIEANGIQAMKNLEVEIGIDTIFQQRVTTVASRAADVYFSVAPGKLLQTEVIFNDLRLMPGIYFVTLNLLSNRRTVDMVHNIIKFHVEDAYLEGGRNHKSYKGIIISQPEWKI